jgi:hypothetical protein
MEDKSRQGIVWAVITLSFGIGAIASPHPLPKLLCSLGAIGAGTMAVDCFSNSAKAAYQQLAAPPEYPQLPSHAGWRGCRKVLGESFIARPL